MSSTNKTTNYELSQFIGTDKPAWLADYNQDMGKIDTQMKANADAATAASGAATAATTAIGTLENLTTDNKTNLVGAINEVDNHADNAQNTATTASNNANQALANITTLTNKFDLSSVTNLTVTTSSGTISSQSMRIAKNNDGSVAKVYGIIEWTNSGSFAGEVTITMTNTGLGSISEGFSVSCAGIRTIYAGGINSTNPCTLTYKTNGDIEYKFYSTAATTSISTMFIPFITFIENFGDQ